MIRLQKDANPTAFASSTLPLSALSLFTHSGWSNEDMKNKFPVWRSVVGPKDTGFESRSYPIILYLHMFTGEARLVYQRPSGVWIHAPKRKGFQFWPKSSACFD
jgi:hypothetical protein